MSRSIHTNHRIYNSELKADHANEEEKKSRLKKIRKDISKKREMKKQMGQRLRADKNPGYFVAVAIESVPIHIHDAGEYIHYAASPEDLRGVLRRLPRDLVMGLDSIHLCLGKEYQEERTESDEEAARDPFTGRLCGDAAPFYFSPVSGTYWTNTCKIFLYADVYSAQEIRISQ